MAELQTLPYVDIQVRKLGRSPEAASDPRETARRSGRL